MTPYNVMTNLETSDTGVTVVTNYSYYQVLCQCMDTLTIVKNGKAVHKVMLKYNVYDRYTTVDTITAAVTLFKFIKYAITHPVDALIAFSATPMLINELNVDDPIHINSIILFELFNVMDGHHKFLNVHNLEIAEKALVIYKGYAYTSIPKKYLNVQMYMDILLKKSMINKSIDLSDGYSLQQFTKQAG